MSCQPAVTKACGISSSADTARHADDDVPMADAVGELAQSCDGGQDAAQRRRRHHQAGDERHLRGSSTSCAT